MIGCGSASSPCAVGNGRVDPPREGQSILPAFGMFYLYQFLFKHYAVYLFGALFCDADPLGTMAGILAPLYPVWFLFFVGRRYGCSYASAGILCLERYGISRV